jgi:O-antigen/teichoic acid export membrane protein
VINFLRTTLYSKLKFVLGIDFHIGFTLLLRCWSIFSGAVTTLLITRYFPPADQGYYYTIISVLAVQVFFELGLNQVVVNLVSHEAASLVVDEVGNIKGNLFNLGRLKGLMDFLRNWYRSAALLFIFVGGIVGFLFIAQNGQSFGRYRLFFVWVSAVFITSLNLFLSPELAFIEAIGKVGQVARIRTAYLIVGSILQWLLIINGGNLWVILPIPVTSLTVTLFWLRIYKCRIAESIPSSPVLWRRDIFPLQWRIAVSWICGYFIFNLFTPIIFKLHGPVQAGRIGVALSIFSSITGLGLSWINAHIPAFSKSISLGQTKQLNHLFDSVFIRAVLTTASISLIFVGTIKTCELYGVELVKRIAPSGTLIWIGFAAVLNTIVHAAASYMRAHREEPMLTISVASALTVIIVLMVFKGDIAAMMRGYALVVAFVSLPWTAHLFFKYRNQVGR